MENWGPGRICLRASNCLEEPNILMDDVGLMFDIVNNRLGRAFYVSTFRPLLLGSFC